MPRLFLMPRRPARAGDIVRIKGRPGDGVRFLVIRDWGDTCEVLTELGYTAKWVQSDLVRVKMTKEEWLRRALVAQMIE